MSELNGEKHRVAERKDDSSSLIAHRASLTFSWLMKEIVDAVGSALALIALAPLLFVIGLLVGGTSPGPIIFRRRVVGLGGAEFDAFKFRTMVVEADQWLARDAGLAARYADNVKLRDDPRLTPVGALLRRLSLDELPQLLNVLRGQMSLVGPRMISPDEVPKYAEWAAKRLSVKPGITGLWQVSGRQERTYEERIALDLQYIDDWSLALDAWILLKTVPAVLSMQGAY
jgi:lipopolysaccharide/colanic/teichoic acid biosynthesis glycosyltransferase